MLKKGYHSLRQNQILLFKANPGLMRKRLFITDLDGTLMTDQKTISQKDLSSLEKLQKSGVITALATGRSMQSLEKALEHIGLWHDAERLPFDFALFSTGAGIMEFPGREIIFQKNLLPSDVKDIMTCFDRMRFDYMVHRAIPHTKEFVFRSWGALNPDFETRLAVLKKDGSPIEDDFFVPFPATQVLAVISNCTRTPALEAVRQALCNFSVIQATSPLDHQSMWIEVFHKEVSKSKAAGFLSKRLSINREDVICVGNDFNDEDLLAWSGKGYVVENAPEALSRKFETLGSNNKSGVSRVIEKSGWISQGI